MQGVASSAFNPEGIACCMAFNPEGVAGCSHGFRRGFPAGTRGDVLDLIEPPRQGRRTPPPLPRQGAQGPNFHALRPPKSGLHPTPAGAKLPPKPNPKKPL